MAKNANKKGGVWQSLRNAWKVEDIRKKLTVEAAKFTESAKQKIEAVGGKAEVK